MICPPGERLALIGHTGTSGTLQTFTICLGIGYRMETECLGGLAPPHVGNQLLGVVLIKLTFLCLQERTKQVLKECLGPKRGKSKYHGWG